MDVDDKTRFVLPASQHGKDASSYPQNETDSSDETVFIDRKVTPQKNNSHFSISQGENKVVHKSQDHHGDATVFTQSINPVDITPSSAPQTPKSNDGVVIKNRFELSELLGVGGMGAVYKAVDRRKLEASDSDPYVAIKVLNDDFKNHPDAFISLQREARKSQTLAHPNIVNVFDFDRDGEMVFMTMEYLEGAPLDALLRESAGSGLPKEQALTVLADIAKALIYAHSHHIVHSDFKPGNIFVTDSKGTKVFDFGISRAVKPSGTFVSTERDETVFDAANLGALTPAYASLEMLEGKDPAPSDDVYALACVAYELFCGRHPFNKTPADKAKSQRLEPKKIKHLSRRQWQAIKRGLALSRADRTATVSDFYDHFFGRTRWPLWVAGLSVVSVSLVAGLYGLQYTEQVIDEQGIKEEIQVELEQELLLSRIGDKETSLMRLLGRDSISQSWEDDVRQELQAFQQLAPKDVRLTAEVKQKMTVKFLSAADAMLQRNDFDGVSEMLIRAGRWEASEQELAQIEARVIEQQEQQRLRVEQERSAALRKAKEADQKKYVQQQQQQQRQKKQLIAGAITKVEGSLRCGTSMNVSDGVGGSLAHLASLDRSLANRLKPDIAKDLEGCFKKLSLSNPARADQLLQDAQQLLPEQENLQALRIDYCNHLKPGGGGRSSRLVCQDQLDNNGKGPLMVVVKAPGGGKLAIGKYEVTALQMKPFCRVSGACGNIDQQSGDMPVHSVSIELVEQYLRWLSDTSGHRYRLPTEGEWKMATAGYREDPDRNCHLRFGAIQKGDELVAAKIGKPGKTGLVNAAGNVQEFALSDAGQLMVLGGARDDPMSRCLVTTKRSHNGQADDVTGFRVVREI